MTKKKATRKLSDISFEKEGSAIALVSKHQGGPANGRDVALVMKSTENFSDEFLKKAQQIQVTMEIPEFLERFFNIWGSDAEVLANLLGYVREEGVEEYESYDEYVQRKIDSFTLLKSAYETESVVETLSKLDEDGYLQLLNDQVVLEKALSEFDSAKEGKASEQPVDGENLKATEKEGVNKSSTKSQQEKAIQAETKTEGNKMTVKDEMIKKSVYEEVQKAKEKLEAELKKSADIIAEFKAERQEAITKARKSVLAEALEDQEKVDGLFKAVGELEDEAFTTVVEVIKSLQLAEESNEMFQEKGTSGESDEGAVSALRKSLEQKYNPKGDK